MSELEVDYKECEIGVIPPQPWILHPAGKQAGLEIHLQAAPNRFHRWAQRVLLGFVYERNERAEDDTNS